MLGGGRAPSWLDVSRETLAKLSGFQTLVEKWNPTINLVAKSSIPNLWERHILDSAQFILHCPTGARKWVDFGSGGGFPGLVVAIIAQELRPELSVSLVESDKRKAAFLAQATRLLQLNVAILTNRAESLAPFLADVLSARALAPLTDLCVLASRHLAPSGVAIFAKGAQAETELMEARKLWKFDAELAESRTDPLGRIIIMQNVRNV